MLAQKNITKSILKNNKTSKSEKKKNKYGKITKRQNQKNKEQNKYDKITKCQNQKKNNKINTKNKKTPSKSRNVKTRISIDQNIHIHLLKQIIYSLTLFSL